MAFNQVQTNGIAELFATPFLCRYYPDTESLNKRLQEIVLERERMSPPPSAMSNVGGWQSMKRDLLDWPYPEMATLRDWIVEAVKEMTGFTFGGRPAAAGQWQAADLLLGQRVASRQFQPHPQPPGDLLVGGVLRIGRRRAGVRDRRHD